MIKVMRAFMTMLLVFGPIGGFAKPSLADSHQYSNPLIRDTRDPDCSLIDGVYHLIEPVGGARRGAHYEYRTSRDLVNWSEPQAIFQQPPGNGLWQGHLLKHTDGRVYLYYTATTDDKQKYVRVAVGDGPAGPFVDQGLLITASQVIDPYPFRDDDGSLWLYYKNPESGEKSILVQRLESPGTLAAEAPTELVAPQPGTWEDNGYPSVEGPTVVKLGGTYFLLYTGGPFGNRKYAVGYATSDNPRGPFQRAANNPILSNAASPGVYSPGVPSVVQDGAGDYWLVYRQRATGERGSPRQLTIDRLDVSRAAEGILSARATNGEILPAPVPLN